MLDCKKFWPASSYCDAGGEFLQSRIEGGFEEIFRNPCTSFMCAVSPNLIFRTVA
jgi:hypothetical protein